MPNDPKWRTIARASKQTIPVVLAVYVHLLTIASGAIERGKLMNVNSEDLASALDVDCSAVDAVLEAMQGRVLEGEKLSGWDKRQVNREDSSTERVKRYRERKETPVKRNVTQMKPDVTADKKREEEINAISKTSSSHPEASLGAVAKHPDLSIYEAYPRKEGKGAAMTEINKAVQRLAKGEAPHPAMTKLEAQRYLMRRVLEYARSPAGMQPDKTKIPHPSTWFHQKRYDDDQSNWHHTEALNGNRNHGKTAGNLDALAEAERFARERHSEAADDFGRETAGTGDTGYASDLLEGSGGLLLEGH
jgi:hypothetical protein